MTDHQAEITKKERLYKKRSVGILPVTRSTLGGLRIAQPVRTSNAEAHACMNITRMVYTTPVNIYCCLAP